MANNSEAEAQKAAVEARKKARLAKQAAEAKSDVAAQKAGVEARKQERLAKKAAEEAEANKESAQELRRKRAEKVAERKSEAAVEKAKSESKARMAKVAAAKAADEAMPRYTVKAGDSLGAIAVAMLGNANRANDIFEANKDILDSPSMIQIGQVLKIPAE